MASVYWYPSTCFFEGTNVSEGRGTDHPFCIFGHPSFPDSLYLFMPLAREGAKEPKYKGFTCHGWNVYASNNEILHKLNNHLQLQYLLTAYQLFPVKDSFFIAPTNGMEKDYFFNKLAGNSTLMIQIKAGKTMEEIRKSWQPKLEAFKLVRKKYLIYNDF